jgi:hypothetical protein
MNAQRTLKIIGVTAVLGLAVFAACSKKDKTPQAGAVGDFVAGEEDSFPRIRYFESGLVSLNDRCPVRKTPLNPKMQPVYVNGLPIGFC